MRLATLVACVCVRRSASRSCDAARPGKNGYISVLPNPGPAQTATFLSCQIMKHFS